MKAISLNKLDDQLVEYRKELDRLARVEDGFIILSPGRIDYPIKLGRCNSYRKIVWWVSHLAAKNWVTPLICAHNKRLIPHGSL